jgi:hypothetical protein
MKVKMTPVAQRLVELIENDAEELATNWYNDVCINVKLPSYHQFDKEELYNRAFAVYSQLGQWIAWETTKEDVAKQYLAHGAQRKQQKFELAEVVQALIRMRVHLFRKVLSEGLLDTAYELNQAIELYIQVVRYFDRAVYFTIVGYMKKENVGYEIIKPE